MLPETGQRGQRASSPAGVCNPAPGCGLNFQSGMCTPPLPAPERTKSAPASTARSHAGRTAAAGAVPLASPSLQGPRLRRRSAVVGAACGPRALTQDAPGPARSGSPSPHSGARPERLCWSRSRGLLGGRRSPPQPSQSCARGRGAPRTPGPQPERGEARRPARSRLRPRGSEAQGAAPRGTGAARTGRL
ncbi:PREDICTED: atherin-like, partial [Chinchilla lanigera]|uniref:atherin-like n=1 Tax=Chinchilla lanigera TaxID=34839 RepID=UPI0006980A16